MKSGSMLAVILVACAAGCGGRGAQSAAPHTEDGGAPGGGAVAPSGSLAFPSATVPMVAMPPPYAFGSTKAERRSMDEGRCREALRAPGAAPAAEVQRIGKACGDAAKLRAVAAPWSGTQAQGAAAQSFKFRAEAGRCYRAYAAAARSVTSLTVLIVDSSGAVAAEARADDPRVAIPDDGLLCFKEADDASLTVSVGGGEGAFALQLWSE